MNSLEPAIRQAALALWAYHCLSEALEPAELIVGLGSYDLRVADRCAEVVEQGYAPEICFTGASGNWTSGLYQTSEAAAFADHLKGKGFDPTELHLEERATNIGENVTFVREMFPDLKRIIWVTKPQTQRRLRATLDKQWPEHTSIVTAPSTVFDGQPTETHNLRALICEMVGDTWRMQHYAKQGYQTPQPIDDDIIESYDILVGAGFSDHLPDIHAKLSKTS